MEREGRGLGRRQLLSQVLLTQLGQVGSIPHSTASTVPWLGREDNWPDVQKWDPVREHGRDRDACVLDCPCGQSTDNRDDELHRTRIHADGFAPAHLNLSTKALTEAIIALASKYGRYGYRKITAKLQEAGWQVGKDRVQRIWRREGLKVPQEQRPRGRLWLNEGSCIRLRPERANHVWELRFRQCDDA
jgi:helix-turn-helix protein